MSTDPPRPRTFPAIVRLTAAVAPSAGAVPTAGAAGAASAVGAAGVLSPGWALLLGLLLVLLNGFFVAAEFALIRVRPTQLEPFVERGLRRARIARH
ncbi:MAG TPA: CNNM domain-containing protein, partial [Thermoanaerobaculia bacterium]|nr:CNNM domain-containing protein [Thermoanaerobaculia bacterium]